MLEQPRRAPLPACAICKPVLGHEGLGRLKQLAVVEQFTRLVAEAAGDPSVSERTWVLLTEAVEGGWGLWGKAHTNAELVEAARAEIARLSGQGR